MTVRVQSIPDEHYHVYNRGVDKRVIFNDSHDYQRFLLLLLLSNDDVQIEVGQSVRDYSIPELIKRSREPLVSISAFSLLPNHYHLLISPVMEGGISKFMQKVATGYTMYFNKRNERSGALFQGKYKIKHAEDERYLKYLFEYIHLNPIREEFDIISTSLSGTMIEKVEKDPRTSLSVYCGNEEGRLSESVLNKKLFEELFSSYNQHRRLLKSWKEEPYDVPEGGRTSFK